MNKLLNIMFLVFILCSCFFLYSCKEYGGTIIVKNNYSEDQSVTAYSKFWSDGFLFSYEDKYGPKIITARNSDSFNVNSNTTYGIIWRYSGIDKVKIVDVSNGEIIEVTIP